MSNIYRYDDRFNRSDICPNPQAFMGTEAQMRPSIAKTILVVDDDPSMRAICVRTLPAEGFTVLEAEGSSEALKILATRQEPTDLLLPPPGFQMIATGNPYPRVHGHEVIQRTLAMKKMFLVILISSLSVQDRKVYRMGTGHVPFLQKPFSVETLIHLVHAVLAAPPLSYDDPATKPISKQDVRWYG